MSERRAGRVFNEIEDLGGRSSGARHFRPAGSEPRRKGARLRRSGGAYSELGAVVRCR